LLDELVWGSAGSNLVFLNVRSGIFSGRTRLFYEEIKNWVSEANFSRVLILTSTHNPVRKLRASNLQLPTIYKIVSNDESLKDLELQDWANWITKEQKEYGHSELDELEADGFGGDLFRLFQEGTIPATFLTMLSQGGHDILGAYLYSVLLTSITTQQVDPLILKLNTLSISDPSIDGSKIAQDLFMGNSQFKIPAYWKHLQF
jgi:hypothetical protein